MQVATDMLWFGNFSFYDTKIVFMNGAVMEQC